jgi:hypothetical protein
LSWVGASGRHVSCKTRSFLKTAKEPRPRGIGDHGGKYEAYKSGSDVNVQADCPAGAPKRCRIKKEGAGLESDDLEDELRI